MFIRTPPCLLRWGLRWGCPSLNSLIFDAESRAHFFFGGLHFSSSFSEEALLCFVSDEKKQLVGS